jgi:hypothetical protein
MKKRHYERMIERMTRAIQNEAYLEAMLYAYAVLEDRMIAILHRSGGAHLKKMFPGSREEPPVSSCVFCGSAESGPWQRAARQG